MQETQRDNQIAENQFQAEMTNLGGTGMLDAASLAGDQTLEEHLSRIEALNAAAERYRVAAMKLLDDVPKKIERLNVSDDDKTQMMAGANETLGESRNVINRSVNLVLEKFSVARAAYIGLRNARGRWVVNNGVVDFTDDADLQAFNSRVIRYDAINAELNANRASAIQSQGERLKSLGGQ